MSWSAARSAISCARWASPPRRRSTLFASACAISSAPPAPRVRDGGGKKTSASKTTAKATARKPASAKPVAPRRRTPQRRDAAPARRGTRAARADGEPSGGARGGGGRDRAGRRHRREQARPRWCADDAAIACSAGVARSSPAPGASWMPLSSVSRSIRPGAGAWMRGRRPVGSPTRCCSAARRDVCGRRRLRPAGLGDPHRSPRHGARAHERARPHRRRSLRAPDLVVADLSFISLRVVLPVAATTCRPRRPPSWCLVKPQFEAGRARSEGRCRARPRRVGARARRRGRAARTLGLGARAAMASPLRGPAGNVEFLLQLGPGGRTAPISRRPSPKVWRHGREPRRVRGARGPRGGRRRGRGAPSATGERGPCVTTGPPGRSTSWSRWAATARSCGGRTPRRSSACRCWV